MAASRTRRLDRLLLFLTVGTITVSAASLAAAEWWLLELTTHFRLQHLAAQGALFILLGLRARWLWCVALVPAAMLNATPLAPYWPRLAAPLSQESFSFMSANLNGANTNYAAFLRDARAESPDVLLLLEFNRGWNAATRELHELYPHRIQIEREGVFGLALFSRTPFLNQRSFQLQSTTGIDAEVSLSGRSVRILGVHLKPPMNAAWAAERDRQLAQLAEMAYQEAGPIVAVGDFNITPYSPVFAATLAGSGLADTGRARGWDFSWPTFLPILGVPIDLCMISEHFVVLDHRRGLDFGSDHYPVIVEMALR